MNIACARGCTVRRRHLAACENPDDCRGCEPRAARHGRLCWPCHRRLSLMLVDAPQVDGWLNANLAASTSSAAKEDYERARGSADGSPAPLKVAVLDVRQELSDQLASWVDNLCEEHVGGDGRPLRGPDSHTVAADAGYLLTWLDRVEASDWVADLWDELAETMSAAHALAPWRPEMRRCHGISCPECEETTLVIFGGDEDVTCLSCRALILPARYGLWVRVLVEEVS